MPLPTGGAWPPANLESITNRLAEWSAWYEGDPDTLRKVYSRGQTAPSYDARSRARAAQYSGGVVGAVARMWWGRPRTDLTSRPDQLHVPLAADMCQASADLLFAEPPSLTLPEGADTKVGDELAAAVDAGLWTQVAAAAEVGAALGGVYARVTWDTSMADRSFLTAVHADAAVPEFRWGQLVAVTFWHEVRRDGQLVVRHLERHELDGQGVGIVLHGLYEGTADALGRMVPLTEHPTTEGLAVLVDELGMISTESPGLAVEYVPNQRPQRRWRTHPVGAHLGRSDLDGVEGLMDALDETYSSWMRDIRLAKARLIVPAFMLQAQGSGMGAFFDADQDVFTTLNAPPREDGASQITPQQFDIRNEAHAATAQQLVEDILRTAGYSKSTFGEDEQGGAMTATEVRARQGRSLMTRDRKIRHWKPALGRLLEKKLAVDAAIFNSGVTPVRPLVGFDDAVQVDPEALARTNQALFQAQSASAETRVRIQHPDWEKTKVDEEVGRILNEFSVSVPDPAAFNPATA